MTPHEICMSTAEITGRPPCNPYASPFVCPCLSSLSSLKDTEEAMQWHGAHCKLSVFIGGAVYCGWELEANQNVKISRGGMHVNQRNTNSYLCLQTNSHPVCCWYIISREQRADEWVHQAKYWGLMSEGGMWHEHKGDTSERLCVCLHISECASVRMSPRSFTGCQDVDRCLCHLWLPPEQMGFEFVTKQK